ncbi:SgcJ/EcaC family oxidoreductase [bacterium]|nr:SgcJ/EcaC family oxidoreductase [bacterium]
MRVFRILILGATATLAACQAPGPASLSQADLDAINAVSQKFLQTARASDWSGVAATYTEDAILLPPNGPVIEGRANIQAFWEAFPPYTDLNLTTIEIEGSGDLAYVRGMYSLTITPPGGSPTPDSGKFIEIRRRGADGSWLIAQDIFNSDIPLPK